MELLKNRVVRNASWIIACKIVQYALSLLITMLTARYLGPSNFGLINYAASLVAFVVPLMQLGLKDITVQEVVNHTDQEGEILGTSIGMSLASALLCVVGLVAFTLVANRGEKETILVCALYSVILIFQSIDIIEYWYQAKLLSKYTALVSLSAYTLVSIYQIYLLLTGKSIYWFALSNALNYMLISLALIVIYKRMHRKKLCFSLATGKRLFSKSKYYIMSSLMVTIFAQTDKVMIKLMIGDAETGYYSAAVASAAMLGVLFSAIIDSARPTIFESRKDSFPQFELNVSRLYCIIIYFSLAYSLGETVFARLIIHILYGTSYEPAVAALRIIVWYTAFSYVGVIRNIWMITENKQKYLWIINMFGAVANVILNYMMIPVMGINGAALASLITQIFTNLFVSYLLKPIRHNNTLLIRGLDPRLILDLLKRGKKV